MTQGELAARAGIPQPNLSNIEKGKQDVTVTTLRKIAYALDVPPREFFEEENKLGGHKIKLKRPTIEKLAHALIQGDVSLDANEKQIVTLFREILPGKNKSQLRLKKMHHSWLELKKHLGPEEINTLYERVQELKRLGAL